MIRPDEGVQKDFFLHVASICNGPNVLCLALISGSQCMVAHVSPISKDLSVLVIVRAMIESRFYV